MNRRYRFSMPNAMRSTHGFSLIEVLIALLVLSFGLLGLGLLQVINVRYTQSAQHRTVATNLAYEALDMMRANRVAARQFTLVRPDGFSVSPPASGCTRGAGGGYQENIARWKCEVAASLPGGKAQIDMVGDDVTVEISWTDDVGHEDGQGAGRPAKTTAFEVSTRL